jgi:hypothetical protein
LADRVASSIGAGQRHGDAVDARVAVVLDAIGVGVLPHVVADADRLIEPKVDRLIGLALPAPSVPDSVRVTPFMPVFPSFWIPSAFVGAGNSISQTTTTATNAGLAGYYQFSNLAPGTYTVRVTTLSGYVPTFTGKGTTATDSNASPSGTSPSALASGQTDQTIDFGFYKPVSIGNFVWEDTNGNGVQDAGEPGINGVTLTLSGTNGAGSAVSQTTTTVTNAGQAGYYQFSNLVPGTYTVSVTTPSGYVPTFTGKGTTATDSNASPSGTSPSALASGQTDQTIDFGFYKPVTIGDFVWNDTNGNGIQNSGEPGIKGVTLTLTGTTGPAPPLPTMRPPTPMANTASPRPRAPTR